MIFLIATALVFLGGFASMRRLNTHWHLYFDGLSCRWQGDLERAIEYYNQALSLQPKFAEAYYSRGNAKFALKNYQAALEDYAQAIQLEPDFADAVYYNQGNSYARLGNWHEAIEAYTQALHLNLNYAEAYANRGNLYALLGLRQQAQEDFHQALTLFQQRGELENYQVVSQVANNLVFNPDKIEIDVHLDQLLADLVIC